MANKQIKLSDIDINLANDTRNKGYYEAHKEEIKKKQLDKHYRLKDDPEYQASRKQWAETYRKKHHKEIVEKTRKRNRRKERQTYYEKYYDSIRAAQTAYRIENKDAMVLFLYWVFSTDVSLRVLFYEPIPAYRADSEIVPSIPAFD